MPYSEEDCLSALQTAAEKIGKSPSRSEYDSLDLKPSESTIRRIIGSWNKAKRDAGLEELNNASRNEAHQNISDLPEYIDMSESEWRELSSNQRYYLKNKESEKQRVAERKKELKNWFKDFKSKFACEKCGEERSACLEFHHKKPEKKEFEISNGVSNSYSKNRIKNEVEKCAVLCSNCHKIKHA